MTTALVGFTGFVGSNILDAAPFDHLYNSKNISDISGREYDLVVSAGNRADSFRINTHAEDDRQEVDALVDRLLSARIRKLVLISTVCVYPGGGSPDESTPLSDDGLTPYGINRLRQERRLSEAIDTTIVRLPQLYGARLKKGVIYDLAHDYRVEHIDPGARFQYYDVRRLWHDIRTAVDSGLDAVNIASPALSNLEVARDVFGRDISAQTPVSEPSPFASMYTRDMRTQHAALFGGSDGYLDDATQALAGIRSFVADLATGKE